MEIEMNVVPPKKISEAMKICEPVLTALKTVPNGNWISVSFKDLPGENVAIKRSWVQRAANDADMGIQTRTAEEKLYIRIKFKEKSIVEGGNSTSEQE